MAIEAPLGTYKKNNFKIGIVVLVVLAVWFGYDGHFNEEFQKKHSDEAGVPDSTLAFNQKAPLYFVGGAIVLGVFLLIIKDKKVVADENTLSACNKTINYDSIEKIDKTNFESKGYFVVTYKDDGGAEKELKLSDKLFDNLPAVLEHLVAKIS